MFGVGGLHHCLLDYFQNKIISIWEGDTDALGYNGFRIGSQMMINLQTSKYTFVI
jgi:hypothetical protein